MTEQSLPKSEHLGDTVRKSLGIRGYTELRDIQCEANCGHIVLSGKVASYYLKQTAQTIAMRVAGVQRVTNDIVVVD
jgi:osmotically-inducible protein OsmY